MKILQLQSENVKRLTAVTIKPDGSLVIIKGQNGQGKSSVLDSIAYALGGKELQPPEVIRRGQETAQVVIDLDEYQVTRRWTSNEHSYLEVRSKEGAKYPSPQAMLDKLVGRLSFDPLSFMRLEPKAQAEALRRLVGLDFTDLELKRAALYEQRTKINTEGKSLKARVDAIPSPPEGTKVELESVDELLNLQARVQDEVKANDRKRGEVQIRQLELGSARKDMADAKRVVETLEGELAAAKDHLRVTTELEAKAVTAESAARAAVAELVDPDLSQLRRKIATAEAFNVQVRRWQDRAKLIEDLEVKRRETKEKADAIAAIDKQKADALAAAKFPVPELGFGEVGLTLNGLPLEQASSAEQLRVSLAMGLALNPKLKVLLIRDGSLLDEKALAAVAELAEKANAQVWLERVGNGDAVGVLIEDGQVAKRSKA